MSVPGIVQSSLNGEQVAAQVPIGGDDYLFVTPSRTLIYRADGLLSDESVEEYPHDAERVELSESRRKATISLDYGLEGPRSFTIGAKRIDDALHPVLAGVLRAAGVTDPDETVKQTYRFSELTLIVTSDRVVKHVGSAVFDEDFEEYPYADVTAIGVEEGSVASQIVVEVDGRPQRTKAPNDQARHVHEQIREALVECHGLGSYAEFEARQAELTGEDAGEDGDADDPAASFDSDVEPLTANPAEIDEETGETVEPPAGSSTADEPAGEEPADDPSGEDADDPFGTDLLASATDEAEPADAGEDVGGDADGAATDDEAGATGFEGSAFEPAGSDLQDDTAAELARLADAVEHQNELLAEQQATIEQLIEELNRGR